MCFTRPRYQVSVYRTIGPLVLEPIGNPEDRFSPISAHMVCDLCIVGGVQRIPESTAPCCVNSSENTGPSDRVCPAL